MLLVNPARLTRWACVGAFLVILTGCAGSQFSAYRKDDPGGVYPAGEMSGEPAYYVGWRHRLYR